MKTYYLIDYENVRTAGLEGCDKLLPDSKIIIFFTPNANKLDMDALADNTASDIKMICVPAGKQSADMHLVSYLGYLFGKEECTVVIISSDTDFDNIIKFWREKRGMTVSRQTQIKQNTESSQKKETQRIPSTKEKNARELFNEKLNKSPYKEKKEQLLTLLLNAKDKQSFNNALTKIIPSPKIPLVMETFKDMIALLPSAPAQNNKNSNKKQREQKVRSIYGNYFKDGVYKEKREEIISILVNCSTKQQMNTELCRIIPGSNVSAILKQFDPYIKTLK